MSDHHIMMLTGLLVFGAMVFGIWRMQREAEEDWREEDMIDPRKGMSKKDADDFEKELKEAKKKVEDE